MAAAAMFAGLVQPPAAAAQGRRADSTATISGFVRDATTGAPLPFAAISSNAPALQRFSGEAGRFAISKLPSGVITLKVRHLGYVPREVRLDLDAGEARRLSIDLAPLAVSLRSVVVRASRACDQPGPPRAADDSAFAAVFDQLRQNAEQYRMLATSFPFVALLARTLTVEQHDGSLDVQRQDSVVMKSENLWPYRPGRIVERAADVRTGSEYVMHIPTLDVLTDSLFIATHCFSSGGMEQAGGQTLMRIDFRVASSVAAADVNGTMYLDSGSFQIRRSVVRLSHPPSERRYLDSAEVVTEFGEVYPSVPVIRSIWSRNRFSYPSTTAPRASIEVQRLAALGFVHGHPGDGDSGPTMAAIVDTAPPITSRLATPTTVAPVSAPVSTPVELAPVVVNETARRYLSPALRGFDERRRMSVSGYFIDDSVLRRDESRRLGDILRSRAPGVVLADGAHSASFLMRSPRCASGGPPQVYLDGVPLSAAPPDGAPRPPGKPPTTARDQLAAIPPFDLSQFGVSSLAGVEYYPDSNVLPLEFSHTSDRCGALLLWSRER